MLAIIHRIYLYNVLQELVSEKIKLRERTNELEQLTHELEKVGLNKEKLIAAEQAQDERLVRRVKVRRSRVAIYRVQTLSGLL